MTIVEIGVSIVALELALHQKICLWSGILCSTLERVGRASKETYHSSIPRWVVKPPGVGSGENQCRFSPKGRFSLAKSEKTRRFGSKEPKRDTGMPLHVCMGLRRMNHRSIFNLQSTAYIVPSCY